MRIRNRIHAAIYPLACFRFSAPEGLDMKTKTNITKTPHVQIAANSHKTTILNDEIKIPCSVFERCNTTMFFSKFIFKW